MNLSINEGEIRLSSKNVDYQKFSKPNILDGNASRMRNSKKITKENVSSNSKKATFNETKRNVKTTKKRNQNKTTPENVVSSFSITADKILPISVKLPRNKAENSSNETFCGNFDVLNEALNWNSDAGWSDSSSASSESTGDSSGSETSDFCPQDEYESKEIENHFFDEVCIGGNSEVCNRNVNRAATSAGNSGNRTTFSFNNVNLEAQVPAPRRRAARRGSGSWLLLGVVLLIGLLALLTLSQVVLVENKVLDQLGPDQLRPAMPPGVGRALQRLLRGSGAPGGWGATQGGWGATQGGELQFSRAVPLMRRKPPSVEVTVGRTVLKRLSLQIAEIILEESLSIYNNRNKILQQEEEMEKVIKRENCDESLVKNRMEENRCTESKVRSQRNVNILKENTKLSMFVRKEENSNKIIDEVNEKESDNINEEKKHIHNSIYTETINDRMHSVAISPRGNTHLRKNGSNENNDNGNSEVNNNNVSVKKSMLKNSLVGNRILTVGIDKTSDNLPKKSSLDRRKTLLEKGDGRKCESESECGHVSEGDKSTKLGKPINSVSDERETNKISSVKVEPNYSDLLDQNSFRIESVNNLLIPPQGDTAAAENEETGYMNNSFSEIYYSQFSDSDEEIPIYFEEDDQLLKILNASSIFGRFPPDIRALERHQFPNIIDPEQKTYEDLNSVYKKFLGPGENVALDPIREMENRFQVPDKLPVKMSKMEKENMRPHRRLAQKPHLKEIARNEKSRSSKKISLTKSKMRASDAKNDSWEAYNGLKKAQASKEKLYTNNLLRNYSHNQQKNHLKDSTTTLHFTKPAKENKETVTENGGSQQRLVTLCPLVPPSLH
ncbi:uncharacterized protein LOC108668064 [Hyalella azteca]|uniref:Uncharacterized protein LOC108668064 n=1 Tax=Hyalella azteca TaxID=294128 RepID=A0A8B7NAR1_HYAAZ|nr:uncharacterized protein LOC108668064 [Hyalella azteca]